MPPYIDDYLYFAGSYATVGLAALLFRTWMEAAEADENQLRATHTSHERTKSTISLAAMRHEITKSTTSRESRKSRRIKNRPTKSTNNTTESANEAEWLSLQSITLHDDGEKLHSPHDSWVDDGVLSLNAISREISNDQEILNARLLSIQEDFGLFSCQHSSKFQILVSMYYHFLFLTFVYFVISALNIGLAIRWFELAYAQDRIMNLGKIPSRGFGSGVDMKVMASLCVIFIASYRLISAIYNVTQYSLTVKGLNNRNFLRPHEQRQAEVYFVQQFLDFRFVQELGHSMHFHGLTATLRKILEMKFVFEVTPFCFMTLFFVINSPLPIRELWYEIATGSINLLYILAFVVKEDSNVFRDGGSEQTHFVLPYMFRFFELISRLLIYAFFLRTVGWIVFVILYTTQILGNFTMYVVGVFGDNMLHVFRFHTCIADIGLVSRNRGLEDSPYKIVRDALLPFTQVTQCLWIAAMADDSCTCAEPNEQLFFDLVSGRFFEGAFLSVIVVIVDLIRYFTSPEVSRVKEFSDFILVCMGMFFLSVYLLLFHIMRIFGLFKPNSSAHRQPLVLGKRGRWEKLDDLLPTYDRSDLDVQDQMGAQPTFMMMAAEAGQMTFVERMLALEIDPNVVDRFGETALHKVSRSGQVEMVDTFIEEGVDVNWCNQFGWSALHKAAFKGNKICVRRLLDAGANRHLYTRKVIGVGNYSIGFSPTGLAFFFGTLPVIKAIIDEKYAEKWGDRMLLKAAAWCEYCQKRRQTPLIYAISKKKLEIAHLFLDVNLIDPNLADLSGQTPLHKACEHGFYDIAERLVEEYKVELDLITESELSPLHVACQNQHQDVAELLVAKGCLVSVPTKEFANEVFHEACVVGNATIVRMMLDLGANINTRDNGGWSALQHALHKQHKEICLELLSRGADLSIRNMWGERGFELVPEELLEMVKENISKTDLEELEHLLGMTGMQIQIG